MARKCSTKHVETDGLRAIAAGVVAEGESAHELAQDGVSLVGNVRGPAACADQRIDDGAASDDAVAKAAALRCTVPRGQESERRVVQTPRDHPC